jgi:hypothetical protein
METGRSHKLPSADAVDEADAGEHSGRSSIWLDASASVIRTLVSIVFIFWLLSLTPTRSDPSALLPVFLLIGGAVIYGFALKWQVSRVTRARRPGLLAAESLIISAVLFVAIFSAIYVIIDGNVPGSFSEPISHFTATYFALTVLATVGFGDITAVSNVARFMVMVQMALGLGFIAVIIRVFTTAARRASDRREQERRNVDGANTEGGNG